MAQQALFQIYLRLRPSSRIVETPEQWLLTEGAETGSHPTHITLQPPNDSRKRAIERFSFTKVFKEDATQLDVFEETGAAESLRSVVQSGRDALIATLGVTGSGKVSGIQQHNLLICFFC